MITLLKFGPHFGLPDPSPFVVKLETYLRLADIDYISKAGDVRKTPKKKIPVLIDGSDVVADSQFAIEHLKAQHGDKLNEGLSDEVLARHHMLRLGLENHTYFLMVAYRWLHTKNAPIMRDTFFAPMGFMGKFIFKMVQKEMRRTVYGQGLLRHSWEELEGLVSQDVAALEAALGDRDYFGGERPTEIDCTAFGFLSGMIVPDIDTPFRTFARASRPLVNYHNRMTERAFADYKGSMIFNA